MQESVKFEDIHSPLRTYNEPAEKQTEELPKYLHIKNHSVQKIRCTASEILFKGCSKHERRSFQNEFKDFIRSTSYLFIIFAHVKIRMSQSDVKRYRTAVSLALKKKIQRINSKVESPGNRNFTDFRRLSEISDIQYGIKGMQLYFDQKIEEALETFFRKDRTVRYKGKQCQTAFKTISQIQKRLKSYPPGPLFPYIPQTQQNRLTTSKNVPDYTLQYLEPALQRKIELMSQQKVQPVNQKKQPVDPAQSHIKTQAVQRNQISSFVQLENSYPIFLDFYKLLLNYDSILMNPYSFVNEKQSSPMIKSQQQKDVCKILQNPQYFTKVPQNNKNQTQNEVHETHNTKNQFYLPTQSLSAKNNQSSEVKRTRSKSHKNKN